MSEEENQENPSFATRFLPKNRLWEVRKKSGRKPTFETPEQLWDECVKYFEWIEENPSWEHKAFGSGKQVIVYKMRSMTLSGLYVFLGITRQTWAKYERNPDFFTITARTREVILDQKIVGASADQFNPSIVSRELSSFEKQEQELSKQLSERQLYDMSRLTFQEQKQLQALMDKVTIEDGRSVS